MERTLGKVDKGWGYEVIWANNDKYCGKILVFERAGSKCSMQFHKEKDKTWFINNGKFKLRVIDLTTCEIKETFLKEGDTWNNPPMLPHQLEALEDNSSITEVSTADSAEDNYRILPGDSQQKTQEENNVG